MSSGGSSNGGSGDVDYEHASTIVASKAKPWPIAWRPRNVRPVIARPRNDVGLSTGTGHGLRALIPWASPFAMNVAKSNAMPHASCLNGRHL